jgi:hypothetical protein
MLFIDASHGAKRKVESMMSKGTKKAGDLQVWWIPQVPMPNPFTVDVASVEEGAKLLTVLADYDLYQLERKIKPDFCNAGGLRRWCDDSDGEGNPGWEEWYDEATGEDNLQDFVASLAAA